jgi:hypothetical protein
MGTYDRTRGTGSDCRHLASCALGFPACGRRRSRRYPEGVTEPQTARGYADIRYDPERRAYPWAATRHRRSAFESIASTKCPRGEAFGAQGRRSVHS